MAMLLLREITLDRFGIVWTFLLLNKVSKIRYS
uniref:Uncharacterized protein n=1 Tax=Saccharolobus solfataricus (strain 98/2) TaxID=555311 RepID=D0KQ19_SACS9